MAEKSYVDVYFDDLFGPEAEAIARTRKPVIAAVAGYCLGGGCELAMMCDFIIAADTAKFGQPEINLGIVAGMGGTQRLTRLVGKAKAMDMNLTGRFMDAVEAERAGLVSRVVPAAQLRDEVMTLFFAGFETTARTLGWAYYLLTQNPETYAKLHAEVDEVLQGQRPTVASLYQLPYTRMVADETLRLYPATGMLARQTVADDEIGGYHIPAGSLIGFSPHILHRHPSFWNDPEVFRPERFDPEQVEAMHKCAYIPFSTGPRICIGNNFALLEIVVVLAMVAQKYEWRFPRQDVGFELHGTTRPQKPLHMTLHRRS
jgi:hypothetical protein